MSLKDFFITKSLKIVKDRYPNYDDENLEVIEYGLTALYMFISKTIVVFTLAYFLGIIRELIILLIIYSSIKSFSFGIHAEKSSTCLLISTFTFLVVTYICIYFELPLWFDIIIGVICIIYMFIHSPADTEKKPIINPKRRVIYKILSTLVSIILVLIAVVSKNSFISNCCILSLLLQCLSISPVVYRIAGKRYNNYMYYK